MPALIALGATVELRRGAATRALPLEALYLDYMKKDLTAGEFVVAVTIPAARQNQTVASYKLRNASIRISQRSAQPLRSNWTARRFRTARVAFGGMAATPARAKRTEAALEGRQFNAAAVEAACVALAEDFKPLSDMRASADYRLHSAQSLLRRFFREEISSEPVTRTHAAEVSA